MKWVFSIRTKLFSLVFSAFLALIAGIYWQIGAKAESVSNAVIDRSLTQSSKILDTRIESRFLFIREMANGIASDGRVLPLVYDNESLTLQDLSLEYEEIYDFDILFFMDSQGNILARSDRPEAVGVNLAGQSSLFDNALNGKFSSGFIVSNGKLMQTVVAPIFDNVARDIVRGGVVLAYELSREIAQEIVALTESHIGFFVFTRNENREIDGVKSSYMTNNAQLQKMDEYFSQGAFHWQDIVEANSGELRKSFTVEDNIQHSVFQLINGKDGSPLGFAVAMRSATDLKRPFKEIQQRLLIIGGICLVFASLFAALMALGVSRPIIRLVDMTKLIQGGLYPSDDYKSRSQDEIGLLQNALIKMGQSLGEKAELEAYLAELAAEVDNEISIHLDEDLPLEAASSDDVTRLTGSSETDPDKTRLAPPAKGTPRSDASKSDTITSSKLPQFIDQRYRVASQLGSGAIGVVYLAHDLDLDEKIAVKVMQKAFFDNTEGLNFKEEIRLARKITHRNIVRTFDFGSWEDVFYITMEYVQGSDVGRLIAKKGALDVNIAIAISKQVCSAMIAAHQMGIIHRDLKPSNMIINRQGILKIMDFGLAMRVNTNTSEIGSPASNKDSNPPGLIMGTPRYMAPEQFKGSDELDARTDIYAIGVIMFTILNGDPPFSVGDFNELALKHINDPIPQITGRNANLPQGLENIIHQALAKKPEDRFQSVREMLEQLNNITT